MKVWINGHIVNQDDATVSAFDAGLQHGVGLFETIFATASKPYRLMGHLKRLRQSSEELGLAKSLHIEPLADAVHQTLKESGLKNARIRLTLTGGDLNMLQTSGQSQQTPTILIAVQPATQYPEEMFTHGIRVVVADGRLNPFDPMAGHKTLNYWGKLRALQAASGTQSGEALWLSVSNHLMSGSVSNVFLLRDNVLMTPIAHGEEVQGSLPSPVLPGITRGAIIEFAEKQLDLEVKKQMLTIEDLLGAEELFLTNSGWGVLPVAYLEKHDVGDAKPGKITLQLRDAWKADCEMAG